MAPAPDTKMGAPGLRYPHASIISGAEAISFFIFDGVDPVTGMQIGIKMGDCTKFATFEEFHDAWYKQFKVGFDFATTLEYKNRYVGGGTSLRDYAKLSHYHRPYDTEVLIFSREYDHIPMCQIDSCL